MPTLVPKWELFLLTYILKHECLDHSTIGTLGKLAIE
jgi:hypothetical protein